MVSINYEKCGLLIQCLKDASIPKDRGDAIPPSIGAERSKDLYLVLAAICHQTTPLEGTALVGMSGGVFLRGWDYLKARFIEALVSDPALVSPRRLAAFSASNLVEMMADGRGGGQITNPEGRARLLQDLGNVMTRRGWSDAESIYKDSGGYLKRKDGSGMFSNLAHIEAFKDPLQKKSIFYLSVMKNNGLWEFKDPQNLGSPIDYHVTRGFLRLGIVQVLDRTLYERLVSKGQVRREQDLAIRGAVYAAVEYAASVLNKPGEEIHHLFWNIFRNCCNRESPHCDGCPSDCKLPRRYRSINEKPRCMFSGFCDRKTELLEHNFQTDWY